MVNICAEAAPPLKSPLNSEEAFILHNPWPALTSIVV
jgi:hypothetical protein